MTKPTFEQCLDYLENELGYEFLDYQKEIIRKCYEDNICTVVYQKPFGGQTMLANLSALTKLFLKETTMDCNNCEYLNITEAEQKQRGNHIPHICTKYNQRVLHRATNKIHNEYLYPCDKCLKEN